MAAVMRAMTGSMSGLSKTRSRSEATYNDASTSPPSAHNDLARVTSRLVPPGSTAPTSAGILINSNRPYGAHSSAASSQVSLARTPSATDLLHLHSSSRSRDASPSPGPSSSFRETSAFSTPSSPAPATLATPHNADADRGRSRSSSRHAPGPSTDSTNTTARMSIRFAPLPEVRQRSYSTGRNVWFENDDISEMTAGVDGPPRKLERREQPEVELYSDSALADSSSSDEDERSAPGIFGSWKSDLMGKEKEKGDDPATPSSSYTAKLLRPLAFGLGKKKSSSSSSSKGASRGPRTSLDASDLSRIESNESSLSRGSLDGGSFKSTGVPMRKTRTWELGDTAAQNSSNGSRRHAYPSVAQRSKNARKANTQSISAPDPSFVEWGFGKQGAGQGVGSVRSAKAGDDDGEGEDGGGMAWVRRRKAEREAAAALKKKEEEDAAAAAELVEADITDDIGTPTIGSSPPDLTLSESVSGTTTPIPLAPTTTTASLLSSTRPALCVITPTLDTSILIDGASPSPSHTTASRSSSSISTPSNKSSSSASTSDGEGEEGEKNAKSAGSGLVVPAQAIGSGRSDGDESEDEEDETRDDDDDDSDLDEDELAQEEALAEEARRTLKCAASERFSDANHKTRMLKVDNATTT